MITYYSLDIFLSRRSGMMIEKIQCVFKFLTFFICYRVGYFAWIDINIFHPIILPPTNFLLDYQPLPRPLHQAFSELHLRSHCNLLRHHAEIQPPSLSNQIRLMQLLEGAIRNSIVNCVIILFRLLKHKVKPRKQTYRSNIY